MNHVMKSDSATGDYLLLWYRDTPQGRADAVRDWQSFWPGRELGTDSVWKRDKDRPGLVYVAYRR